MNTKLELTLQVVAPKDTEWVYFGRKFESFETFWGDLQIYNDEGRIRYIISLFCGYIRHIKEFNNPYRANIEPEDHLPAYQPKSLLECIKQIWDKSKGPEMNIRPSDDVCAIKGYYDRPDSKQDLDVGRIVQMCLMTGTDYKLTTWAPYSGGFACLGPKPEEYDVHAITINKTTIDTKEHGNFYASALYMDHLKKQRAAEEEKRVQRVREEEKHRTDCWNATVAKVMQDLSVRS